MSTSCVPATGLPGGLGRQTCIDHLSWGGKCLLRAYSECYSTQWSQDLIWLRGSFRLQGDNGIWVGFYLWGRRGCFLRWSILETWSLGSLNICWLVAIEIVKTLLKRYLAIRIKYFLNIHTFWPTDFTSWNMS